MRLRRRTSLSAEAEARLAEHRRVAEPVIDRIHREYRSDPAVTAPWDAPSARQLLDDDLALSVLVATVRDYVEYSTREELRSRLQRRKLPFTLLDIEMLTALAEERGDYWRDLARCRAALAAIERVSDSAGPDAVVEFVRRLERRVGRQRESDWTSLAVRLRRLEPDPHVSEADLSALKARDPWTKKVRRVVERDYRRHGRLLDHLASATSSRPSKKWLREAGELLDEGGEKLVRYLLESTLDVDSHGDVRMLRLSHPSATLVRGCLWASTLLEDDGWLVPVAGAIVEHGMREEELMVTNAALYALGESPREEAIALLSRLAARVKDRRFLKGIEKALEAAAARRGLTRSQLRESLVPTFGLAPDGTREVVVGGAVATIRVEPPGAATTTWTTAIGRAQKSAPAELKESHAAELAALKSDVAEIRKELGAQRLRVEGLLAEERVWSFEDWRRHYLEHPLVQAFARRLIWRFDDVAAIPLEEDELPAAAEVRLWHPIHESTDEVARWRAHIREQELVQPFKQAFREVYLVAPAEEQTGTYSNRFAAHIVRYPQVYALTKQRGWHVVALGPYDNDGGRQWREFEAQGIRAEFWMEHADENWENRGNLADLASTDQVRFYRGGEREPMRLVDVPSVVFSEAMRDVDLFVGVTSIAADPEWIDHGNDRYHGYWREASFGELGQSALVRREVLDGLLPTLKIADRCSLADRYLVVRGKLRTYRIHLGSGNVLMEPNDEYLCIVPARGTGRQKVFLPFPEDERFSVILSKAFLLADDERITDSTILAQIRR
jgi:Domain of unknown function (DUF4132)